MRDSFTRPKPKQNINFEKCIADSLDMNYVCTFISEHNPRSHFSLHSLPLTSLLSLLLSYTAPQHGPLFYKDRVTEREDCVWIFLISL